MEQRPQLLRETAEIALTEIKRFIEPRLLDSFHLRRVSAPLYLPVGSPLLDSRYPGVHVHLDAAHADVEIVASLDVWLRDQLRRYDIAPGFGVFTIMNALRPDIASSATASPHIAAWAWQRAIATSEMTEMQLAATARELYALFVDAEKMILDLFPHLHATLHKNLDVISESELVKMMPEHTHLRRIYQYLHPGRNGSAEESTSHKNHCAALFVRRSESCIALEGELWVWNNVICRPLMLADVGIWRPDNIAGSSVGGNIFRDFLAMQLLHQPSLLV